ncbi:class I SAM-dependent methyltransferase [Brevirhabdus sp.]|uniref:class I SAM-dependent methyltransferase n=1 Tax=Brevirhabdus sp. TaxID=2004514 RepID=UPI004059980E
MSPLEQQLVARIAATGPIGLAEYMSICLLDPRHGYYATRDPFGQAGDFTTAPEISQMFGELMGLALAQSWLDQGSPSPFTLAELGPGRGTLMRDLLRATARVPGFHAAARVTLLEASPSLRKLQRAALGARAARQADAPEPSPTRPPNDPAEGAVWIDDAADLTSDAAPQPVFVIANEFFDALPIRQFQRQDAVWRERLVAIRDGRLSPVLGGPVALPELAARMGDTVDGDVVEICPEASRIAGLLGTAIARHGGVALIVDYGAARSLGDTFQALHRQGHADPFAHCGEADLTAHVDFGALAQAARPAAASPLVSLGVLLERLGITARARALAERLQGDALASHIRAHRRLTHPQEMGSLFRSLALVPPGSALPPGYAP